MTRNHVALWACGLLLLAASARPDSSPLPAADYTVARSWRVAGTAGWNSLILDGAGARLFITRDDHVDVLETSSGRLAGSIPHTQGVHGVAFAPGLKRGFASNSRSNTVSVFELDSLRIVQEVPISGTAPDSILYEPQHDYIVTGNRESADLCPAPPNRRSPTARDMSTSTSTRLPANSSWSTRRH
jgi:DNA-binding beta-propeller fold protein YncE